MSRRVPRGLAADSPTEIHHVRDWQLEENDYCLDPTIEHNLPQRPKRIYNRDSIVSVDEGSDMTSASFDMVGRRSESIGGSAVPPHMPWCDCIIEEIPETSNANDGHSCTNDHSEGEVLSYEEWKFSGGYV